MGKRRNGKRTFLSKVINFMSKVYFIRHGESESNVDKTILRQKPNHLIELTGNGVQQAIDVALKLKEEEGITCAHFVVSPHVRTVQTALVISSQIKELSYKEDFRIREVDIGNFVEDFDKIREERRKIGKFYYRFPSGESCADVAIRAKQFLYEQVFSETYPTIIVCHAATIRVFEMILKDLTIKEFEALPKLKNCEYIKFDL